MKIVHGLIFLIAIGVIVNPVTADIYRYVDDKGIVYYTDKPVGKNKPNRVKLQINSFSSPKVSTFKYDHSLISKRSASANVVMYSTTWCGYCKKARRYFNRNSIAFNEYDVEKSTKGKKDYRALGGKGVPIILVGDRRMNGFSENTFKQLHQK